VRISGRVWNEEHTTAVVSTTEPMRRRREREMKSDETTNGDHSQGSARTGRVAVDNGEEGGSNQSDLSLVDVLADAVGGSARVSHGSRVASFEPNSLPVAGSGGRGEVGGGSKVGALGEDQPGVSVDTVSGCEATSGQFPAREGLRRALSPTHREVLVRRNR
jgi:hypothetical protein